MNIQAEKLELVKLIIETDDPGIIKLIKKLFTKNKSKDFWDSLTDAEKSEIKKGIEEINNGEIVDYELFMKRYQQ